MRAPRMNGLASHWKAGRTPKMLRLSVWNLIIVLFGARLSAQNPVAFTAADGAYRLQPSDVIELEYRYTPELNQTVTIPPDGNVTLNMVGKIRLAGLTTDEARVRIQSKAAERLNDPELTLALKDFVKPVFFVTGEVGSPGRFELRGHLTALDAIAMAGGFRTNAKHSQVLLFRRVSADLAETHVLDMKALTRHPRPNEDIKLRADDILVVPTSVVGKIERFVRWTTVGVFWNPLATH